MEDVTVCNWTLITCRLQSEFELLAATNTSEFLPTNTTDILKLNYLIMIVLDVLEDACNYCNGWSEIIILRRLSVLPGPF